MLQAVLDDYPAQVHEEIDLVTTPQGAPVAMIHCNYYSGEGVTHMDKGIPAVIYDPGRGIALSDFIRSLVYSSFATLKLGMDILAEENVKIDSITGHGGNANTCGNRHSL